TPSTRSSPGTRPRRREATSAPRVRSAAHRDRRRLGGYLRRWAKATRLPPTDTRPPSDRAVFPPPSPPPRQPPGLVGRRRPGPRRPTPPPSRADRRNPPPRRRAGPRTAPPTHPAPSCTSTREGLPSPSARPRPPLAIAPRALPRRRARPRRRTSPPD